MPTLRGRVARVDADGRPHVEVPSLAAGYAFGPLEVAAGTPALVAGDRVVVATMSAVDEDLVVIASLGAEAPPTDFVTATQLDEAIDVHTHHANDITSGTIPDDVLPNRLRPDSPVAPGAGNGDLNLAVDSGHYSAVPSTLNTPSASAWWFIEVTTYSNGMNLTQRATRLGGNQDVYTRQRLDSGSWTAWVGRDHLPDVDWVTIPPAATNLWTGNIFYARRSGLVTICINVVKGGSGAWSVNDAILYTDPGTPTDVIPAGFRPRNLGLNAGGNYTINNGMNNWHVDPGNGVIRASAAGSGSIAGIITFIPA